MPKMVRPTLAVAAAIGVSLGLAGVASVESLFGMLLSLALLLFAMVLFALSLEDSE